MFCYLVAKVVGCFVSVFAGVLRQPRPRLKSCARPVLRHALTPGDWGDEGDEGDERISYTKIKDRLSHLFHPQFCGFAGLWVCWFVGLWVCGFVGIATVVMR